MSDNEVACALLEAIQRSAHLQLGIPIPSTSQRVAGRGDIAQLSGDLGVLPMRVDELKAACRRINPDWDLAKICFGLVPGGGLDAYTARPPGVEQFAVVIPEGLTALASLVTRIVLLVQPIIVVNEGEAGLSPVTFDQQALATGPYAAFRTQDVLRAYFLWGEPYAALPHRPIPYEDALAFLMTGVELYVLAHEVAHVLLGHLPSDSVGHVRPEHELQADELALHIVSAHFAEGHDYPAARAGLCGLFFQLLNNLWERTVRAAMGELFDSRSPIEHPPAEERLSRFAELLPPLLTEAPPWYAEVQNGLRLALEVLPAQLLPRILDQADALGGLSDRVAPASLAHLCRAADPDYLQQWWRTIAELMTSRDPNEQLLGFWFLKETAPVSLLVLYEGLLEDDESWQEMCRGMLVAISPLYGPYMPRLLDNLRRAEEEDRLGTYIARCSAFATMEINDRIGSRRLGMQPWNPLFFSDIGDSSSR